MSFTYVVWPVDGIDVDFIYPYWTKDYAEALEAAQDAAEDYDKTFVVLQRIATIEAPGDTIPMHDYNGVTPGVDFPVTL